MSSHGQRPIVIFVEHRHSLAIQRFYEKTIQKCKRDLKTQEQLEQTLQNRDDESRSIRSKKIQIALVVRILENKAEFTAIRCEKNNVITKLIQWDNDMVRALGIMTTSSQKTLLDPTYGQVFQEKIDDSKLHSKFLIVEVRQTQLT